MQSEPLRTGFVVQDSAGTVYDLPIQLVFPTGTLTEATRGIIYVNLGTGGGGGAATSLILTDTKGVQWIVSVNTLGVLYTTSIGTVINQSHILGINLSLGGFW